MTSNGYCSNYYSCRGCRNAPAGGFFRSGECYECAMMEQSGDTMPRALLRSGGSFSAGIRTSFGVGFGSGSLGSGVSSEKRASEAAGKKAPMNPAGSNNTVSKGSDAGRENGNINEKLEMEIEIQKK